MFLNILQTVTFLSNGDFFEFVATNFKHCVVWSLSKCSQQCGSQSLPEKGQRMFLYESLVLI